MNIRRDLLSKLKSSDRVAVMLLRGGGDARIPDKAKQVFAALRERLIAANHILLSVDAPIVSPSELYVLGWLAALQRSRVEPAVEMKRIEFPEAQICASWLDEAGYRLGYHHVIRITEGKDSLTSWSVGNRAPSAPEDTGIPSDQSHMVRHRVIRLLLEKGPMSVAELNRMGVSRQTVSAMAKQGLLRRVRLGVYAAVQPPMAPTTADGI